MFDKFKNILNKHVNKMIKNNHLFVTNTDADYMYDLYLDSFPDTANPVFRERRTHDCSCCKSYIRKFGSVVTVNGDGTLTSIWDMLLSTKYNNLDEDLKPYKQVCKALSEYVKSVPITSQFYHYEYTVGVDHNKEVLPPGKILQWDHFFTKLQGSNIHILPKKDIAATREKTTNNFNLLNRAVKEITPCAVDTVLELIDQNNLYRGPVYRDTVQKLKRVQHSFNPIISNCTASNETSINNLSWKKSAEIGNSSRIINTLIGTLLLDLSKGEDLQTAVGKFESKAAPENYKRPKALITKSMIEKGVKELQSAGYSDSVYMRFATETDITVNNVIYVNRDTSNVPDNVDPLLSMLSPTKSTPSKKMDSDNIKPMGLDEFLTQIVPKAKKIELLINNKHPNNLMSLIAPVNEKAKNILAWANNFSWSYINNLTGSSIKSRVTKKGGNINGILRNSLAWFNTDDLDIHVTQPSGVIISFDNKKDQHTSGQLDVDMNINGSEATTNAVENITWTQTDPVMDGEYKIYVHNYAKRNISDVGCDVEIEDHLGNIYQFNYPNLIINKEKVLIAIYRYSASKGIYDIKPGEDVSESFQPKETWGIKVNEFEEVSLITHSPNHWDGNNIGDKHVFFILKNCKNPNDPKTRGLYNEYLDPSLSKIRKFLELVGSTVLLDYSDDQLSGIGFSSTEAATFTFKVTGTSTQLIKIRNK